MPDDPRPVHTWLTDMDGVLVHEEEPIPGATDFIDALKASGLRFLVLTNNSIYTPRDLRARLLGSGIDVPEESIWTSALATAQFLADQRPRGSAYVVGEAGLTSALHDIGYVMTERNPDYVVLGETRTYSFESITRAVRLVEAGARFIATNPDVSGPSPAASTSVAWPKRTPWPRRCPSERRGVASADLPEPSRASQVRSTPVMAPPVHPPGGTTNREPRTANREPRTEREHELRNQN